MINNLRFLLGVLTGALGLVVVFQNTTPAEVQFLFWSVEGPIYLLLGVVLVLGALTGHLVSRGIARRRRKKKKKKREPDPQM